MTTDVKGLSSQFTELGVRPGDSVMLHASLRKLGLARSQGIADGAGMLLDALESAVRPNGTLLMVLGSDYPMDWVNYRAEPERAALLAGSPAFDWKNAKVLPEVGHLAEAFRQRPGTRISPNPSGRFGASGARADALIRDQTWNDYYGPGSPLQRLCESGGKVLRLGANLETVTVLHYAEYVANVPEKRTTRWYYVLEKDGVPQVTWVECLNDSDGIADWEGDDYFAEIMREYLKLGRHAEGPVGRTTAELLDAADLVAFGARWMEQNLL